MERVSKYTDQEFFALRNKWVGIIFPQVEKGNFGKYLSIDLDTGEYEMDDDPIQADRRLKERRPNAEMLTERVGFPNGVMYRGRSFKVVR